MLGKEILNCNPEIEMEELGDVVQSYINKILFLRVCEDRNIETYQSLLQIADHNSYQELIAKFKAADSRYNSGLFEEKLSAEIIGNVSSSFWSIICELYSLKVLIRLRFFRPTYSARFTRFFCHRDLL